MRLGAGPGADQRYGHRHDAAGFDNALQLIGVALARRRWALSPDDLPVVSAAHGFDPAAAHTNHARESVPRPARCRGDGARRHDAVLAERGASVLDRLTGEGAGLRGASFIDA